MGAGRPRGATRAQAGRRRGRAAAQPPPDPPPEAGLRARARGPAVEPSRARARPSPRAAARRRSAAPGRPSRARRRPRCSSARARSGTDSSASTAWPIRSGISAAGDPARRAARRRGGCGSRGARAVARRSPAPASPIIDSGALRGPRRSARPRRRCARRPPRRRSAPAPRWRPAASAAAFLAAPASSTPTGSLESSQTTPARVRTSASVRARSCSLEAATRCSSGGHHLLGVGGAAEAGHPFGPRALARASVGGSALGRDEALGDRHERRGRARPTRRERVDDPAAPREGTARNTSRRGPHPPSRLDRDRRGQLDALEVALVLALAGRSARPVRRCGPGGSSAGPRVRAGRPERCRRSPRR